MAMNDLLKGLALGALAGVICGILFAPKSGRETREDIRKSTTDLCDKAKEQYHQVVEKMENLAGRGRETYAEKKERLKKAVEAGVEAYKEGKAGISQA
ncbi:MAG: hypothetical protein CSYNP_04304 [Syntrophus sp. SKADARSKE-3]|nr:hypothetical protein [Syntrophus sp. SKADARSKE-3]